MSWKARAMQAVARVAARRGDVIYRAVGDHVRSTNCAQMRLPLDRAVVVRRGVPVDDATPPGGRHAGRTALGLPAESPLFLNVARLVPEKAQHRLVEAFAAVRSEVPDAHLAIAGAAGPAEGRVTAAIARAGLGDAVSLLGFRPDAREVVAVADVFAFSSLSEGSPGAVVEALVQGTPVAAFAIDPVTELTEGDRHAWLAEPGDPAGLAAAMLDAHRSGADHRAATRQWAVDTYSIEAVARQLGDLLQSRIERARRYHDRDREPTEVR
jgi:glycosyltransferase involved in cell wall biosynthesis